MIKRLVIALFSLVLLAALAAFTAQIAMQKFSESTLSNTQPLSLEVQRGSSIRAVANTLEVNGALEQPQWLEWYSRLNGQASRIKSGYYLLPPGLRIEQLMTMLINGEVQQFSFTLVEGRTLQQVLEEIKQVSSIKKSEPALDPETLAEQLDISGNPEGMFFPDTYFYTSGTSDIELLRRANARMIKVLDEEWQAREKNLPYESSYEALIMASIVERETGVPRERSEIAGVFVRRLQKNMRLQTDPTVIYGLGSTYQGNITRKHLNEYTPYNTYRINGLPPTPIALAGREAIHAALHPLKGSSLYFVAKGNGSHQFSNTLKDHNQAVRKYQFKRGKDYRSSPAAGVSP